MGKKLLSKSDVDCDNPLVYARDRAFDNSGFCSLFCFRRTKKAMPTAAPAKIAATAAPMPTQSPTLSKPLVAPPVVELERAVVAGFMELVELGATVVALPDPVVASDAVVKSPGAFVGGATVVFTVVRWVVGTIGATVVCDEGASEHEAPQVPSDDAQDVGSGQRYLPDPDKLHVLSLFVTMLQIDFGIVPEKILLERSNTVNEANDPSDGGNVPCSWLLPQFRSLILVNDPMDAGNVPEMLLVLMVKVCNSDFILSIPAGTLPVRRLLASSKSVTRVNCATPGGIVPVSKLFDHSNFETRFVQLHIHEGIVPDS